MAWNWVLANQLPIYFQPDIFWKDIPTGLAYGENISRVAVFILTLLMPISISTFTQKAGFLIYLVGLLVYFASWLILIYYPLSGWSMSMIGFMAPSYTPLLWLIGLGLIGNSFYFNLPFKPWLFIAISCLFLLFHNLHVITVFWRTH